MAQQLLPRRSRRSVPETPETSTRTGLAGYGTVWCAGDVASVTIYDSPEHVEQIHEHEGHTMLLWLDPPDREAVS